MTKQAQAKIVTGLVLAGVVAFVVAQRQGVEVSDAPAVFGSREKPAEPRETIYRMLDAGAEGDVEAYIDCYAGETARQLTQSVEEMTAEGFANYLVDRNQAVKGIAINEPEETAENAVKVRIEYVYEDRNEAQTLYLDRLDGDWKIVEVDDAQRVPTVVEYGTPVY